MSISDGDVYIMFVQFILGSVLLTEWPPFG